MARKGLFRRIGDAVRRAIPFLPPSPPPVPPRQPPPPPPPPPPPTGGGGGGIWRGPFRETWQNEVPDRVAEDISERSGYSENELFQVHFEILHGLDPEADMDVLEDMWVDYLGAFVNGQLTHDAFFEIWNIDPRDFDWESWRDAMGYGKH